MNEITTLPRLRGRAKATAVTIQYDEYGEGQADAMHAELFGVTMRALGLDSTYGAYRDVLPATSREVVGPCYWVLTHWCRWNAGSASMC